MEIKYQIIKNHNLLILKYRGDFLIEEYTMFMNELVKKPEWNYVEKILTDLTVTNMDHVVKELDELDQIATIRKDVIRKSLTIVMLVDKPIPTASVHLYIEKLKDKYDYDYCSTFNHAINLLDLNKGKADIEAVWSNL